MKYLKTYEDNIRSILPHDPQINDYVKVKKTTDYILDRYFKNNLGVVKYYYKGNPNWHYILIFKNVPENIRTSFIPTNDPHTFEYITKSENIDFALPEDIENYKLYLNTKKYNL